jgi:hypothetical protein
LAKRIANKALEKFYLSANSDDSIFKKKIDEFVQKISQNINGANELCALAKDMEDKMSLDDKNKELGKENNSKKRDRILKLVAETQSRFKQLKERPNHQNSRLPTDQISPLVVQDLLSSFWEEKKATVNKTILSIGQFLMNELARKFSEEVKNDKTLSQRDYERCKPVLTDSGMHAIGVLKDSLQRRLETIWRK